MFSLRSAALLFAATFAVSAHAWNADGHMVIAAIAQQGLTPAARAEADRLLKIDPTERATDFISTGPWADDIRSSRKETGGWHFIDIYFRPDGKPAQNKPDEENVVWAIDKFSKVLADHSQPDAARAEALRFLIHFVGDIHQPLHATSRETDALPKGDRGGNDFKIEAPSIFANDERPPKNLHSLWDAGVGLFDVNERRPLSEKGLQEIEDQARTLTAALPRKALPEVNDQNPADWAQESLTAAKTVVYDLPEGAVPSDAYIKKAQQVVARRATLAGYRLADLLNRLLKS